MVARGNWAVTSSQEVEGTPEVKAIQGAAEGLNWLVPKHGLPSGRPHWGVLPRDGWTHPAQCNPEGRSLFKEPGLNSDAETTPKTADWSQPIEMDDSWAPEAADWLQPEEEDLGGPPILDQQVEEF